MNINMTCDGDSEVKTALTLWSAGAFQANANHVDLYSVDHLSVKSSALWLTFQDGNLTPMGKQCRKYLTDTIL